LTEVAKYVCGGPQAARCIRWTWFFAISFGTAWCRVPHVIVAVTDQVKRYQVNVLGGD